MQKKRHSRNTPGYLFVLPALLLIIAVTIFPYLYAIYTSFQKTRNGIAVGFTGLQNYIDVLTHPAFKTVVLNQIVIVLACGLFQFLLGFSGALALNKARRSAFILRSAILIPWVIPGVVSGLLWKWILDGNSGVLNYVLKLIGIIDEQIPLLSSGHLALLFIIIVNIWRTYPFMMVMYLSGLQSIPTDQYEAACVDGARADQRLRFVTIPNMAPIIFLTFVLATIWNFKSFDVVWVLTKGGPAGASEVFSTLIYKSSFSDLNFGYASALAVIMGIIIAIPIFINLRMKAEK
jgi:multiple sugar transport system permease protein